MRIKNDDIKETCLTMTRHRGRIDERKEPVYVSDSLQLIFLVFCFNLGGRETLSLGYFVNASLFVTLTCK